MGDFKNSKVSESEQTKYVQELLRGEISAIETYEQVIEKFQGKSQVVALKEIQDEHKVARQLLEAHTAETGATPDDSSGAWGAWAQFTTGAAKLLGENAALKALKEGEEHGVKEFQDALSNNDLSFFLKEQIRSQFIPRQQKHIATIETLMQN